MHYAANAVIVQHRAWQPAALSSMIGDSVHNRRGKIHVIMAMAYPGEGAARQRARERITWRWLDRAGG